METTKISIPQKVKLELATYTILFSIQILQDTKHWQLALIKKLSFLWLKKNKTKKEKELAKGNKTNQSDVQ